MIVADTNVWARAYLRDHAVQTPKAQKLLAEAQKNGGVFVPLIALAELAWVLRARWERESILATLEELLGAYGVIVESPAIVEVAIKATRAGNGGFADHLIAQVGFAHGATSVVTFDEKFGKAARVKRLK